MKTLLLILFPILSYSQSFMLKMEVKEFYKDITIIYDTVKVILIIDDKRNIGIIWDDKAFYFDKKSKTPNKTQRKVINKIKKRYSSYDNLERTNKYYKIHSLYLDYKNESYFITLYINDGLILLINHIDKQLPVYFFRMV